MTARDIQRRLMAERFRRSFVLPNYTPKDWWECDVFEITEAGFFVEYEIKLTKGDYEADKQKIKEDRFGKRFGPIGREITPDRLKHTELLQKDERGPSRFFYVAPIGLLNPADLPPWAGLIEAQDWQPEIPWQAVMLRTVKIAPRLHKKEINPTVRDHAKSVIYYRFNNLFCFGKNIAPNVEAPK